MLIPKKLKVGAHLYDVIFPYKFSERTDLRGQTCHLTLRIKLTEHTNEAQPIAKSNIELTFLHEIIHCVDQVYNGGKMDEDSVERMGEGLYQVLQDNGLFR